MPNQPDPNTVSTSFTLPRELLSAVEKKAKREMTNKSDIIRRALLNYLPENERAAVIREMEAAQTVNPAVAPGVVDLGEDPNLPSKVKAAADAIERRAAEATGKPRRGKKKRA